LPTAVQWCGRRLPTQVDRLAGALAQPLQRRHAQLDDVRFADAPPCQPQQDRAGPDGAARGRPLHQPLALEGRDGPRHSALGKTGGERKLAHAAGLVALNDKDEELGRAVDRLSSGLH